MLSVYNYERYDITNNPGSKGPGFTIWFSGCTVRCHGCHNEKLWDKNNGIPMTVQMLVDTMQQIEYQTGVNYHDVILLGGEPMEQDQVELLQLMKKYRELGKEVWLYTSHELHEIPVPILDNCDHIKTGRYIEKLKHNDLLATSNQKMWDKIDNEWRIRNENRI